MFSKYGGEPNHLNESGLCLLSLDGGGVRGLSTLYILKNIMDRLNHERKQIASLPPVKPCEIFDLIGGTSTGGLIAIMLGRLEMDVDNCIVAYSDLAEAVFGEKMNRISISMKGKIKPQFDAAKLEIMIRKTIAASGVSETDLLNDGTERGCRSFVCTADRDIKDIVRLRSYSVLGEPDIRATICEAALATSAATTFFDPVSIGDRSFADGALGANNPVDEVEGEASNIWCAESGDLKPLVKCFISIGTGNPGKTAFEDGMIKFLGQTLVNIATETENTEKKFIARWAKHFDERRYFRFNVDQGLQNIGLDEYKRKGAIEAATTGYMTHTAQKFRMRDCIQNLTQKQNKTHTSFNSLMNDQGVYKGDKASAQACLQALFLTDPRDDREKIVLTKGNRVDGTCEWIRSNHLYKSWLSTRSKLLWLSGGPGKGKTMLSIFLAEELEQKVKQSRDALFLQYFCDYKDERRKTAVAIVRGLIYQLLVLRPKLFDHILPTFKTQKELLFSAGSFESLWRVFETMVRDSALDTVYCVVDGVDECDEASLEVLLKKLKALFCTQSTESSVCHLNLVLVSRDFPDLIPDTLSNFPRIRLDSDAESEINGDIGRFIEVKVNELSESRRYPEPVRIRMKEVLRDRAQGTFLWVGIVAAALRKYKATEVEKALDGFPSGLTELYARMLLQIEDNQQETAAKILRWITMAVRPLTFSELIVAIEDDIQVHPSLSFSREEVMRDKLSYCGSFVTVKEGVVGLIHQSAKDYLLRKSRDLNPVLELFRIEEDKSNMEIARKCLDYLQDGCLADGPVYLPDSRDDAIAASRLEAFPLLSYAVAYWPEHARNLARSEDILNLSYPFNQKNSEIRDSWLESYRVTRTTRTKSIVSFTLLHVASYFGIIGLAQNILLKKGWLNKIKRLIYLNRKDSSYGRTALTWAAGYGYEAVVRLLLEKGAAVDAVDSGGGTALLWAAKRGHKAVVRLLVEKGAAVDDAHSNGRTALFWAAGYGQEALVRLLLEKGAAVNAVDSDGGTALLWAAQHGQEALVRLLLEKGAAVLAEDSDGRTALSWAVGKGHEAMVRLLLEKGAPVDAANLNGRTALIWATKNRHEAVVRLLLEKGAVVDTLDSKDRTALSWAAGNMYEAVVRLLLENGAAVDAVDSYGKTALFWAAETGHEAIVRLLLEKGAAVDAADLNVRTALFWAAANRHMAVVRLLLEKGAAVDAVDSDGGTALFWAVKTGHEALVRLLLEKGAAVDAVDSDGRTPLFWAAKFEHDAIVQLLLDKGVGVDAQTGLFWATKNGHEAVVRLLVERGAVVDAVDSFGRTALSWAAENGQDALVRLLLEKGAVVDAIDSDGRTALSWAVGKGHEALVRLLLEKGAVVDAVDFFGRTALSWAAENGRDSLVRLLLKKGAAVDAVDSDGLTALFWAAKFEHEAVVLLLLEKGAAVDAQAVLLWATKNGHEAVVRLLLEKGAAIDSFDSYGQTALSLAAENGHETMVRLLLERGAAVDALDSCRRTALFWAAENGHEAVVRLLLEKGAHVNPMDLDYPKALFWAAKFKQDAKARRLMTRWEIVDGQSTLFGAAKNGHEAVARLLLEKGAMVDTADSCNRTALSWAAGNGHEAMVRLLLAKGAKVNSVDSNWQTPRFWAAENGHGAVFRLLKQKGGLGPLRVKVRQRSEDAGPECDVGLVLDITSTIRL